MTMAAIPEHHENAIRFAKLISDVLATGKVKPSPVKLFPNGLASVKDGFKYMIDGKVRKFPTSSCVSM